VLTQDNGTKRNCWREVGERKDNEMKIKLKMKVPPPSKSCHNFFSLQEREREFTERSSEKLHAPMM